jgi:hypothetical protein
MGVEANGALVFLFFSKKILINPKKAYFCQPKIMARSSIG